jgi:hypothetical protein
MMNNGHTRWQGGLKDGSGRSVQVRWQGSTLPIRRRNRQHPRAAHRRCARQLSGGRLIYRGHDDSTMVAELTRGAGTSSSSTGVGSEGEDSKRFSHSTDREYDSG